MSVRSFLDTNILVYADDGDTPEKQRVAIDLVSGLLIEGRGVVSTQVLAEYFVAATKKLGIEAAHARKKLGVLGRMDLVRIEFEDVLAAIDLHRLHQISFWDGLIVRAALASGCRVLFTEDLQHGFRMDSLEVVNPFL